MNAANVNSVFRSTPLCRLVAAYLASIVFAFSTGGATAAEAAPAATLRATGVIEGRIFNPRSDTVVENARVSIEGTSLLAFSDADGNYRLPQVPAGAVHMRVFFTGFPPHSEAIVVPAGGAVRRDITLTVSGPGSAAPMVEKVVELDEFVVAASREMEAAAIAINEQRFAPNVKNVVSTDEFGAIAEGNTAEFLRYMPGITVNLIGGEARTVSIDGAPAANTPVTYSGFELPNPNNNRAVEVGFFNLNNISRIEVALSPTPESPGSALTGSINMVPRSSFERTKAQVKGNVYLMMRDDAIEFGKVRSLYRDPRRVVHPGFDLSWIVPLNPKFGFSVATGRSIQYSQGAGHTNTWRGVTAPTDGGAFPHTTPGRPYLSAYTVQDAPKESTRRSLGLTLDFKVSPNDRIALSYQYTGFDSWTIARSIQFNPMRIVPGIFTPTSSQGVAGAGNLVATSGNAAVRTNRTYMPTLSWWHNGPTWKAEAGASHARGINGFRDLEKGLLLNVVARRTGVTIDFDQITDTRPGIINVVDSQTRAPVDPFRLGSYSLASVTTGIPRESTDLNLTAFGNIRRDFMWRVPVTLKLGLDFRRSTQELRGGASTYTYRDAAVPGSAGPFADTYISRRGVPYGYPGIEFPDSKGALDYFKAHPDEFTLDENAEYRGLVNQSKREVETVSSAYWRADVALFDQRLRLVGGLRAEQTNIDAEGPLTDPSRNVRRDASGQPILDAAGRPVPISTSPLEITRLTLIERGARVQKEYLDLFPSLNASFNLRENLIARGAVYRSIGKPSFNQYAGGITLPNTDNLPGPINVIRVNNAGIKPWLATTAKLRLEYYFEGVGQISAGVFRRDYTNFFGNTVIPSTPDFLALYGLDPDTYGAYDVSTQYNLSETVRMEGFDVSYKQALTFLPEWARGIQVFGNWSSRKTKAQNLGALGFNDIPHSGAWGVSMTRPRFNLRVNVSFRAEQRRGEVTGSGIEPGTYNFTPAYNTVDLLGEYNLGKRFALFANLRNVGDVPNEVATIGPSTPGHARLRSRERYGSLWTFGVKGNF